ncbi:hypothetical protein FA014_01940 [Cellulomonas hominis]|uniref:Uncharacterized protein n=1 Tax=Cellulomonas hominis TaxID=156981 RepID=A0A7Z8K2H6_9CELL|nr:hypothetical protein [Cellulomonas hominis]TKR27141.1 hypothetical protein FA014_01940 [Cellulomonas hominis]
MDAAAWISVVGAAVALGVGIASWFQLSAMKEQTELQRQVQRDAATPYVWVDFRTDQAHAWLVQLVVKNEGPTVAEKVRVQIDPPVNRVGSRARASSEFGDLSELAALSSGITSMPPGREMRWTIGSSPDVLKEKALGKHHVTVTFEGPFGPVGPLEYDLDFADFPGSAVQPPGSLNQIAESIDKLTKRMS